MRSISQMSWYRRLTQVVFFLITGQWLFVGFLRCPYGVPFVCCSSCPLGDCTGRILFFPILILLLVGALLLGRVFCGWMCPLGYLQDACGLVASHRRISHSPFGWLSRHDRYLKWLKYVVLVLVVYLVVVSNFGAERAHPYVVRSPEWWRLEASGIGGLLGLTRYPVRAGLLFGALVGALLIPRMWCRWLCPLGALLSVLNRVVPFRLRRDEAACCNCGRYPRECVQHTMPGSTDCIVCGECVTACPSHAIHVTDSTQRTRDTESDSTMPVSS